MHRIPLPNAFLEGENGIYLFDGDETVLVDAGFDTTAIRDRLLDGFATAGFEVADLDRIYLTHYHIDHCGLLEWLVSRSGASVHAHPDDLPLIEGDEDAWQQLVERRYRLLEQWGVPDDRIEVVREALIEGGDVYGDVTVEPVSDSTEIDIGGTVLRTMHTPGHSLGHLAFVLEGANEILTGDALLPEYTPNVGGADIRVENSLGEYLRTLDRIAAGEYDRAWPGHREPIDDPTSRATEIITHHEKRAVRVLRALDTLETTTPWAVSKRLFGDLDDVHILHGPGETYAHLDHMRRTGALERDGQQYRMTAETRAALSRLDGETWSLAV